ncbi:M20 metallopeptidase family protein [Actinoallomurus rhizosphaericola]|uniref:M20 metallopeptidase family protein n=1 Tax=Actinoallomurus rhizosphaericola TaxID=2952536 RepID=UPI00209026B2|nr:M20 family metallopeptidase [Actinoallomurus rhizosphaericola]MCO5994067.1 M20 family metallopeptidase [Actinoallomurus rhizosphaericola]
MPSAHVTRDLQDDLLRLRRDLHREPEVGLELPRTQEKVLAALDGLPLDIRLGRSVSSVTAVLRGSSPGPAVLLRADMDALPLTEGTGLEYASRFEDRMHACGHDLHTAMLVGAARILAASEFAGSVIFMFQPGEEGFAGARYMIEEGVLDAAGTRPVAAYGLHVASSMLPGGFFMTRRGTLMAAAEEIHVTVRGAGGHGSQPFRAKDPIPAACEMVTALQTFATRSFDAFDPVVITVGSFHAGTAANVIPAEARFALTIRCFSREAHARVLDGVDRVVRGIAAAHDLGVEVDRPMGYPATINTAAEAEFAASVVGDLYGAERFVWGPDPLTAGEDFSYVLEEVPGAFVFLGACPPDRDPATAPFNHAPDAVFDDGVLADGAALLAELALRRLASA